MSKLVVGYDNSIDINNLFNFCLKSLRIFTKQLETDFPLNTKERQLIRIINTLRRKEDFLVLSKKINLNHLLNTAKRNNKTQKLALIGGATSVRYGIKPEIEDFVFDILSRSDDNGEHLKYDKKKKYDDLIEDEKLQFMHLLIDYNDRAAVKKFVDYHSGYFDHSPLSPKEVDDIARIRFNEYKKNLEFNPNSKPRDRPKTTRRKKGFFGMLSRGRDRKKTPKPVRRSSSSTSPIRTLRKKQAENTSRKKRASPNKLRRLQRRAMIEETENNRKNINLVIMGCLLALMMFVATQVASKVMP